MLFSDQILQNLHHQKARLSICFKTRGQWAFEALRENQNLDLEFEKFDRVFKTLVRVIKKLGHVFVL